MARQRSIIKLSKEKARSYFLKRQLLTDSRLAKGKLGVLQTIERLGYIQIDTINVVEMQDYRFYLPAIKRKPKPGSWSDMWSKKCRRLIKNVLKRIEKEGPLTPSDFSDIRNRKRGTWWDWKPAKAALEVLFWRGELMIKERRNFQRVYDLTERVLPQKVNRTLPTEEEEKTFFAKRALGALGIATIQDINRYIGVSGRLDKWIRIMKDAGEVSEVSIEDLPKSYYVLTKDVQSLLCPRRQADNQVRLLSPFDNSIILRDRTQAVFDFEYSLECYVPRDKRKYGYFNLPILWHNELVGRVDPKADRQKRVLIIKNLHLEKPVYTSSTFAAALANALNDFVRFNACKHIELSKQIPSRIVRKLSPLIS